MLSKIKLFLQAAISSGYCPPNYPANKEAFVNFFNELRNKLLAGGDTMPSIPVGDQGRQLLEEAEFFQIKQELQLGDLSI